MCGEQEVWHYSPLPDQGSSPRVRGTGYRVMEVLNVSGIIPACAGNRIKPKHTIIKTRDHPRVCGEQLTMKRKHLRLRGSSPRVRGTGCDIISGKGVNGIIPACAGNRNHQNYHYDKTRDHPRVCGEQFLLHPSQLDTWGSSPRVRGTVSPRLKPSPKPRDHPRVCGEQPMESPMTFCKVGSSPRVRGTAHGTAQSGMPAGIIPACAGNRSVSGFCHVTLRDHPRVCGEQKIEPHSRKTDPGSSPRVRGTARAATEQLKQSGIIPACAGNSGIDKIAETLNWDHPRVCGEQ